MLRRFLLAMILLGACVAAAQGPAPKDVDIVSPDGTKLRGTFYAATKPGPGVLLLHMCNTTRKSWDVAAKALSEAGIHALTVDNRGFGESGGPRYESAPAEVQRELEGKWPADFDAAYQYLLRQPGVDAKRIGVGGGSCGVNNAVKVAQRHPEVSALVLLAGGTDAEGVKFLFSHPELPLFTAAAADDQYITMAPQLMQWFSQLSNNPHNKFASFPNGRHGTEIFGPHPELVQEIVAFFVDTLATSPMKRGAGSAVQKARVAEFWEVASQPGGGRRAAEMFHEARKRDPNVFLFPESVMNFMGYSRLQAGEKEDAIELFKLNTEAYPASANAQDSLSDGYLATGQKPLALAAEQKCLELLANDPANTEFKAELRKQAEKKIAELQGANK
jgi:dienelactone hydrolase